MNSKKYNPSQFVHIWLPNYKSRLEEHLFGFDLSDEDNNRILIAAFIYDNFQEAVENFAKAQREECLKNAKLIDVTIVEPYTMSGYDKKEVTHGYYKINTKALDKDSILNAPMPQPIKTQ